MRLLIKAERSFVSSLLDETRILIDGPRPHFEKVALLQFNAARQAHKIDRIRTLMERCERGSGRRKKLERLMDTRWKALGYLRATAKYLTSLAEHPNGLQQRPRFFAAATWTTVTVDPWPQAKEWPFMEYSC